MAPVRRARGAGRLPRPRARRPGGDRGEHALLRQPGRHPRHSRLADAEGLAAPRVADPRAELLQVARALLARRAAGVREPARGQRGPLHHLSVQEELVQRDGRRAPAGEADPRAAGLHRRPERRPRQGLVPDRHDPVAGAPGGQPGQARRRARDRGLQALRLRRAGRQAGVHRGADRPPARRGLQARRARHGAGQQVRQRARRRGGRRRHHGRGRQRRQPYRDRPLLADGHVRGRAQPRQGAADGPDRARPRRAGRQRAERAAPAGRAPALRPGPALQRARAVLARRVPRPPHDAEEDDHRPRPPERGGPPEAARRRGVQVLLGDRLLAQLEHARTRSRGSTGSAAW